MTQQFYHLVYTQEKWVYVRTEGMYMNVHTGTIQKSKKLESTHHK